MLRIKNLTKTYKSKKGAAVKALDNVSADFDNKGMVFILGKSGGGKSTLLNLLGGLDAPDSGEIIVKGKSSKSFSPSDFDSYRNTYVGFVFQEYNLIDACTVGNNIGLAPELQGRSADKLQVDAILRKLELVDDKGETLNDRRTNELSAGQKQRVSIARALIKNPEIILADEPTGALDSETGWQLYELLKILAQEKLIIVVTHDRESAEKYGDRIIELEDGVIVKDITKGAGGFAVTKTKKDTEKTDDCKFIKSRLPFRRGFAMGASGLKVKKFRLFTSIFLSAVTFIIFGFSFTAATADKYTAELKTLNAHDMRMIAITSDSYYRHFSSGRGEFINSEIHHLADPQLEEIKKYSGSADLMIISDYYYISALMPFFDHLGENKERLEYLSDSSNPYLKYALRYGSVAELDPGTGEADANLKPDGRFLDKNLCRLPKDFGEIAITDLKADMFMRFGYKSEDGMIKDIKTPDDLIGKKIGELIICGVYSTEGDKAYFEQYDTGYNVFDNNYLRSYLEGSHIVNYTFVYKGFGLYHYNHQPHHNPEHYPIGQVLIKLSGNPGKDRALFNKLTYKDNDSSFTGSNNNFYSARIMSSFSGFVDELYYITEYGAPIGLIVAAVFSVFAALLMMNFLNVSIDFKKKELGILRALGARRKDVLTVCLTESLIIACINIIISLAAILILCFVFNRYFYLSIFNIGFLQIALLFLLCFGVAALATVIPVTRITNKKPIDIINNK